MLELVTFLRELQILEGKGVFVKFPLGDCVLEAFVIDSEFNAVSLEVIGRLGREGVMCWKTFNVWKVWLRGG